MKFNIVSLGCPKNLVESEYLANVLEKGGHTFSEEGSEAVIVNTCAFISDAIRESIETILQEATAGNKKVIVAGCLVERYEEKLRDLLPEAVLFLGRNAYPEADVLMNEVGYYKPEGAFSETFPRKLLTTPPLAYLKIQEGCDNRCAYCTIPSIRGGLTSRPIAAAPRFSRNQYHRSGHHSLRKRFRGNLRRIAASLVSHKRRLLREAHVSASERVQSRAY
jgi:ribosomal protein S12 methylthiotransferase